MAANNASAQWTVELFGGLQVRGEGRHIARFRTHKTGALLAFLAFHRTRSHAREALVELLWPEGDEAAGRNSLSAALSSLRRELEPPGTLQGGVLQTDRFCVGLNPEAVSTDVAQFEESLQQAEAAEGTARIEALARAVEQYKGKLLPGFYEEWVTSEERRLEEAYFRALRRLIVALKKEGDVSRAIAFAERGVALDPHREEAQRDLIHLYAASGQVSAARRQFQELERLLQADGTAPSGATRQLIEEIGRRAAQDAPVTAPVAPPATNTETPQPPTPTAPQTPVEPQTVETTAPAQTPDPRPQTPNSVVSLPSQLTRFFGREREIERLLEMLQTPDMRLVTLSGPGGSGKTRLCIETARRYGEASASNVFFVPLADLQDARLLPEAMIDAIRGRGAGNPSPAASPLEAVVEVLQSAPSLLLLDNFEQLVHDGGALVRTLLERVSSLQILVTSRQRLNVPGEREFLVLPLSTPRALAPHHATPEALCQYHSIQLFADRAQAVRPDFELTHANGPAIAELCRRLDGIPLAIELAAARSKVLAPAQMLARLEQNLDLLATGHKDVEARHRSLRATMAWSYDLLPDELQPFWTRLGIFRGGWTLEESESVCDEPLALDYLEQLQEGSLVVAEESSQGEMRFRMLETLREFALEKLQAAERQEMERRYAGYFLRLAEEAEPHLRGPEQTAWLERLEREQDNFRAVLGWAMDSDAALALRLSAALSPFWETRGHFAEGRGWLERALSIADLGSPVADSAAPQPQATPGSSSGRNSQAMRGRALTSAGVMAYYEGDFAPGHAQLEESLAFCRRRGDRPGEMLALSGLAAHEAIEHNFEAVQQHADELWEIVRHLPSDKERQAALPAMAQLVLVAVHAPNIPSVRAINDMVVSLSRQTGDKPSLGRGLLSQGWLSNHRGDYSAARRQLSEALELFREQHDPWFCGFTTWGLCEAARRTGDLAGAKVWLRDSATYGTNSTGTPELAGTPYVLESAAQIALAEGQGERAVTLLGAASMVREQTGAPAAPLIAELVARAEASALATLGASAFERAWNEGRVLDFGEAVKLAIQDAGPDGNER